MSGLGFSYRETCLICGEDLLTTQSLQNTTTNEKTILKTFVNMILDTNRGWILDSSRNQTIDDFVNVPNYNKQKATNPSDYYSPGLFLTNTISGCKLFIARLGSSRGGGFRELNDQNEMIVNENHVINTYSSNSIQSTCGTIMSMIPPSDEFFSNSFDTNFLPAHATRIVGTYNWRSDTVNQGYNVTLETYLVNNYKYYFSVFVAEDCIGIGVSYSLDAFPNYFVGKIIGSTCDNDNKFYSQYGVFMTKNSYNMTSSGEPAEVHNTSDNAINQNGTIYLGVPLTSSSPSEYSAAAMSSVFTADGVPTLGNTAYYSCYINCYWLPRNFICV